MNGRNVALWLGDDAREILRDCQPATERVFLDYVGRASADGHLMDHAETTAKRLRLHPVTISKARREMEERGLGLRLNAPKRGEMGELVIFRTLKDAIFRIKERARAAIAAVRRKRGEAARARVAGLRKVSETANPLTSLRGEQAANSAALPQLHRFEQGELLGICRTCELPEPNARHRKPKTVAAWSNARPAV